MLDSFKRSYENNSFSTEKSCDVCLEVIETYMQILMPAFQFTLIVQKMSSTIGEVVPLLNIMISKWKREKLNSNYKILCEQLISSFVKKFDFELNSPIYFVSSLFNTSQIELWIKRTECKHIIFKAFQDIVCVEKIF